MITVALEAASVEPPAGFDPGAFWTLVVAVIALVLSVVTLVWQINRAWWERPVIVMSRHQHPYNWEGDSKNAIHELTLKVSNVGDRAVTIVDFGWYYGDGTHDPDIERPDVEAKFPLRLEPHDIVDLSGSIPAAGAWANANGPVIVNDPRRYGPARPGAKPFVTIVQRPARWRLRRAEAERVIYGEPVPINWEGI